MSNQNKTPTPRGQKEDLAIKKTRGSLAEDLSSVQYPHGGSHVPEMPSFSSSWAPGTHAAHTHTGKALEHVKTKPLRTEQDNEQMPS